MHTHHQTLSPAAGSDVSGFQSQKSPLYMLSKPFNKHETLLVSPFCPGETYNFSSFKLYSLMPREFLKTTEKCEPCAIFSFYELAGDHVFILYFNDNIHNSLV